MNQDNRLKLNTKLFQKELFQKVMRVVQSGKSDSPFVIELDTTTICDFKCPECISSNLLNHGSFKKDRLLSLCEEIIDLNVIAVILTGGGEPLLHPAIGDVIKKLAEADIEIGINTNGTLIDKYLKYISKYVSWTRISVDAATPETYGKFRPHKSGSNMFNKVINNLKLLSNQKKGNLGYSFLLMTRTDNNKIDSNYQEVFQAGILAKEIGCDYFELKPMYNMRHYLIPQSIDLIELLKNQLEKLKKIESSTFKVIYPRTLDTIKHQRKMIEIKNYNRCLISELRTLITPNGVYVCPYFRGNSEKKIGDLTKQTFNEIWRGQHRTEIMDKLNPYYNCRFHCIRHKSNIDLLSMKNGNKRNEITSDKFDPFI